MPRGRAWLGRRPCCLMAVMAPRAWPGDITLTGAAPGPAGRPGFRGNRGIRALRRPVPWALQTLSPVPPSAVSYRWAAWSPGPGPAGTPRRLPQLRTSNLCGGGEAGRREATRVIRPLVLETRPGRGYRETEPGRPQSEQQDCPQLPHSCQQRLQPCPPLGTARSEGHFCPLVVRPGAPQADGKASRWLGSPGQATPRAGLSSVPGTREPSHPSSGKDRDGTTPAPEGVRWGETSHVLLG